MSLRTRLFTDRVCPTCSKSVPKAKLDAHQARHERGNAQYKQYVVMIDDPPAARRELRFTLRNARGAWQLMPTKPMAPFVGRADVTAVIQAKLRELNGDDAPPTFTRREIADPPPAASRETTFTNPTNDA